MSRSARTLEFMAWIGILSGGCGLSPSPNQDPDDPMATMGGRQATGGNLNSSTLGGARTAGVQASLGGTLSGTGGARTAGVTMGTGGARAGGMTVGTGGIPFSMGGARTGGALQAGGMLAFTGGARSGGKPVATGGVAALGGAVATGGSATGGTSATELSKFSFFVISYKTIKKLSGSVNGFGGDLRYGETGAGAGLRGADKICSAAAEEGMPGSSKKTWRAFLSATADENGKPVNAIDRIGEGPWYDRVGRLFANQKSELLFDRPSNADAAIKNDFPNEFGVTNHNPDLTGQVDNHDMLTGSNNKGTLYSAMATCKDWTTSVGSSANGRPRVGHSWPRSFGGGRGGMSDPMANWMSALDEAGCGAGVNLLEQGGPKSDGTVGSGGGYGGFYCFALEP